MTVTPHDIGTFLVSSRTREDIEHLVDLTNAAEPQCSCESFMDFKTSGSKTPCAHIEKALHFQSGNKPNTATRGSIFALLFRK